MSYIVAVFRFIILPFSFLWESSLLSIRKMTKGYSRFIKTVSCASSNLIEQKIFIKKETHETKKTTSDDNHLQENSQKLIQKLRKLTIKTTSSKPEEHKINDTPDTLSEDVLVIQQSISEPNEEPKLKVGLMK